MATYEISIIKHAKIPCAGSVLLQGKEKEDRVLIGCYSYLLTDVETREHILVDTGVKDMDVLNSTVTAGGAWEKTGSLQTYLKEQGIGPQDISAVILTHCHYDHASNAPEFKNATLVMNSKELQFLFDNSANHQFEKLAELRSAVQAKKEAGLLTESSDDFMYKGLHLIFAGGHTPGSQMVEVETPSGRCLLTGDAVFLLEGVQKDIPIGFCAEPKNALKAVHFCHEFKGQVLTGHDTEIEKLFDKEGHYNV